MKKIKLIFLLSFLFSFGFYVQNQLVNASNNYKFNTYQLSQGNRFVFNGTINLSDKPIVMDKVKINKTKYYQIKSFGISNNWIKAKDLKVFKNK